MLPVSRKKATRVLEEILEHVRAGGEGCAAEGGCMRVMTKSMHGLGEGGMGGHKRGIS